MSRRSGLFRSTVLLASALGLFAAGGVSAQVYRWEDADGKVHFSDAEPPRGAKNVKEVGVSETNVVKPFQYRQKVDSPPAQQEPEQQEPAESPESNGKRTMRTVTGDKADCAAQKAAYEASLACYAACGRTVGASGYGGGRRNNSDCGSCTDVALPSCRE